MKAFFDQQVVQQFREGNAEAFGELFDRYHEGIYRYILLRIGSRDDAEDLASMAFERLLGALAEKPIWRVKPFLYQIARNLIIDHFRVQAKATLPLEYAESAAIPLGAQDPHEQRVLLQALSNLPDEMREALLLKHVEGMSASEIGEVIGKNAGSVRVLLFRAHRKLKEVLHESVVRTT